MKKAATAHRGAVTAKPGSAQLIVTLLINQPDATHQTEETMQDKIRVYIGRYKGRPAYYMRYFDPDLGKQVARSTGCTLLKLAEREAGKWEAELRSGRYAKPSRMSWETFRDYYAANALPALAASSVPTYEATLNVFERAGRPQRLADVTTARITGFVTQLRTEGRAEATIARHLRHLKAALRWANREGLFPVLLSSPCRSGSRAPSSCKAGR